MRFLKIFIDNIKHEVRTVLSEQRLKHKNHVEAGEPMSNFMSVIICTYNRAHLLERVLRSLATQTVLSDQFEVIVVDDGAEDETPDVCRMMRREIPNLRYIRNAHNLGLASAANVGFKSAIGEYILFTDDDCIPEGDWMERMRASLEQYPVVAGAVESPNMPYFTLCHNIAEFHRFMPGRKAEQIEFIAGANMGFRRPVLKALNGFQEGRRTAPDMECILRARLQKYSIRFVPEAVVIHAPAGMTTFSRIWQYSARHASHTILLRQQYQTVMQTPFVLRSPVLILLCAVFIALKVTCGIYLNNVNLFRFFHTAPVVYALKLAWCWGAARGLFPHTIKNRRSCR